MKTTVVHAAVVPPEAIPRIWWKLQKGVEGYRGKTPHLVATDEELYKDWLGGGDEVFVFTVDKQYGGFLTFKVQMMEGERWGTVAIIWIEPQFRNTTALEIVADLLASELRKRGCDVMNFLTARKGFQRLGPRLGLKPRIIEWVREL